MLMLGSVLKFLTLWFFGHAGMDAISVLWGPWALGMAAAQATTLARFVRGGLRPLHPAQGLRLLATVLQRAVNQVVAASLVWKQMLLQAPAISQLFAEIPQQLESVQPNIVAAGLSIDLHAVHSRTQQRYRSISHVADTIGEEVQLLIGAGTSSDMVGTPAHCQQHSSWIVNDMVLGAI